MRRWEQFTRSHAQLLPRCGLPAWYTSTPWRFEALLLDGRAGNDWSDWHVSQLSEEEQGHLLVLIERFLDAGYQNPTLRFVALEQRQRLQRLFPEALVLQPESARSPWAPARGARVREWAARWTSRYVGLIPLIEGSGIRPPLLRGAGDARGLVQYGVWHDPQGAELVTCWADLEPEQKEKGLKLIERILEAGVVAPWLRFLSSAESRRLYERFPEAF